jgi:hypothetical protein
VRFEVLMTVKMSMFSFQVMAPCGLIGRYQRFGKTYCLHLQHFSPASWRQYVSPKCLYQPTNHMVPQSRRTTFGENVINFSQNSWSLGKDLNLEPLE